MGLDWNNNQTQMPKGLIIFLIVTFLNGVVIEIGRKIRAKDAEEVGVETYSYLWGEKGAAITWLCVLFTTFVFANIACALGNFGKIAAIVTFICLIFFLIFCSIPALLFLKKREQKLSSKIETAAGIWTLGMYLSLGGIPMILYFIFGV